MNCSVCWQALYDKFTVFAYRAKSHALNYSPYKNTHPPIFSFFQVAVEDIGRPKIHLHMSSKWQGLN